MPALGLTGLLKVIEVRCVIKMGEVYLLRICEGALGTFEIEGTEREIYVL